ncbi:hypothetical protein Goklo_008161, partial [Gossypium klotzschianum]|nr:hypothetical protein [Gossypium klotzschianum]
MAATRFEIEKFDGETNFNLWQAQMMAILVQIGLKKNVEVHIDDEDQAMLLLCFLPPSYKSFRETLIYGRDKILFKDVKGHFLSRDKLENGFGLDSKADRKASIL